MLDGFDPGVVVSDLGMPGEDGYQFMARVRARSPVPAIAVSGYAAPADVDRALRAGFQQHLVKPVPPIVLIEALERLIVG